MNTYTKWTWIPSEYVWVIGNPQKHAASLYKDFDENKYWKYTIVINGEVVVWGEGHFDELKPAMIKASEELLRLIKEFKERNI